MSVTLHYTRPNRLDVLHDQLLAAGIIPELVEGLGDDVWLTVADDQDPADVEAVVEAHDATAPPPAPPLTAVELIVQAVVTAPDCPPGVRAAILAAQQAQAGQA
jgi:hypothetical protein